MLDSLLQWAAGDLADELTPLGFGFGVPFSFVVCIGLLVAIAIAVPLWYWGRLRRVKPGPRAILLVARAFVAVLALFLLLDPAVIAERIRAGEQFVVLLFDDSQSMRLTGDDGRSRGQRLLDAYEEQGAAFEETLKAKHQLARYRVGGAIEPLQHVERLEFGERESDLEGAVRDALGDLQGTHVSGVVLFSDGVQQTDEPDTGEEAPLGDVPVYTVGVDSASTWSDVELSSISVTRSDFDKSPVVLTVDVRATGLVGKQVAVEAVQGIRTVQQSVVEIEETLQESEVRLEFIPDRKDWIHYVARVRVIDSDGASTQTEGGASALDRIEANNTRGFVVDNRDKVYRILYVSGRPNWQNKFVRRALEEDKQLSMTSLICISDAEPKFVFRGKDSSTLANPLFEGFDAEQDRPRYDEAVFLRFNLQDEQSELLSGYPTTAEELFSYDLVLWGDVDRELFTTAQMELTRDFVERRGGSLLLLGGPSSFTEGNYAGTLIESMMPMLVYSPQTPQAQVRVEAPFTARPTIEGALAGSWSFDSDRMNNEERWAELPALFGLNRFPVIRPGATIMVEAFMETGDGPYPLFAVQRYGEGRCAVLSTSDTWQWQMRVDHEDDRHGRLWRQMVRNLVNSSPDPIVLRNGRDAYTQDALARFEVLVRDQEYINREGLRTTMTLVQPDDVEEALSVEESIEDPGLYSAEFVPEQTGEYRLDVVALNEQEELVSKWERAFIVEADQREFQNAQYNADALRRMAQDTGGAFFTLDRLGELAEAIPIPHRDDAERLTIRLWHLPIFYVLIAMLLPIEWYVRRRHGQP